MFSQWFLRPSFLCRALYCPTITTGNAHGSLMEFNSMSGFWRCPVPLDIPPNAGALQQSLLLSDLAAVQSMGSPDFERPDASDVYGRPIATTRVAIPSPLLLLTTSKFVRRKEMRSKGLVATTYLEWFHLYAGYFQRAQSAKECKELRINNSKRKANKTSQILVLCKKIKKYIKHTQRITIRLVRVRSTNCH
eukprot:5762270-Amphidinium_carterae.1